MQYNDNFQQNTAVELGQRQELGMQNPRDELGSSRTSLYVYYRYSAMIIVNSSSSLVTQCDVEHLRIFFQTF